MKWPMVKLENLVSITSGFAFKSNLFSESEGVPLIRIRDVVRGVTETFYTGEYSKEFIINNGDILIGMDGDFNRARWKGGRALLNQRVCKIKADESNLCDNYLYHFLPKALDSINEKTHAVTVKHLSVKGIRDIKIPLPPLTEQKRIAAILDKADAIRQKRQQAIALSDDFMRSVFLDMFGDPITNPKGWDKKPLGRVFKLSSGNGLTAKEMDTDGRYPVYGGNGISGLHSVYMFDSPQLIIGRVGIYCGAIHITEPRAWVTDNALYVKEYLCKININYLAQLLEILNLNQFAGRAAQPLVSGSRIYPIEAILPPIEEQVKFEEIKRAFTNSLSKNLSSKAEIDVFFNTLSRHAFSGQL